MNKSVYVVQTEVISLGGKPFLLKDEVKAPFQSLFTSKTCFTDLRQTILDSSRYIQPAGPLSAEDDGQNIADRLIPLPGAPFIPGWGQVCFNTRSAVFSDTEERTELAQKLAKREEFWDRKAKKGKITAEPDVFGFDDELDDQRMNMLYFEIHNPLYLTAFLENREIATGRVFLHVYPCGYLVFHLAVRFSENLIQDGKDLTRAIRETQPWRKNNTGQWESRLINGNLDKVLDFLFQHAISSFINPRYHKRIKKRNWFTNIRIFEDWNMHEMAKTFFEHDIKAVELKRYENEPYYDDETYDQDDYRIIEESIPVKRGLITSREGLVLCLPEHYRRKKALGQFWKVIEMAEYTLIKDQFYDDLANYLRPETEKLLDYRLDKKRKLSKESLFKFSIYRPELLQIMSSFEKHIHSATSFYRFIHSCIADGIGHYEKKDKVKQLVEKWITEVEKWKPKFTIIWDSVIGPLIAILGLVK